MILVSGSLAYDCIMDFPGYFREQILPEKLHVLSVSFLIEKMEWNFGGTAGNIAYNLALLGEKPTILASAGNDFEAYERWLRMFPPLGGGAPPPSGGRVDLSYIRRVKDVPTAAAYIITDQADNQIAAFYPGAMGARFKIKDLRLKMLQSAQLAVVAPGNVEDMKALPRLYKKYGVPYIYDPGQNIPSLTGADLRAGIDGAKVFISNDYELAMVLKKTGWAEREVLCRVGALVTTLGEKGSLVETSISNSPNSPNSSNKIINSKFEIQKFVIPPTKPRNTSDPTGAGDAYRAGFIKGLLMGLPYDKVGKLASTVAVYTVEKYGTQTHVFSWSNILKRYRENFKESLL